MNIPKEDQIVVGSSLAFLHNEGNHEDEDHLLPMTPVPRRRQQQDGDVPPQRAVSNAPSGGGHWEETRGDTAQQDASSSVSNADDVPAVPHAPEHRRMSLFLSQQRFNLHEQQGSMLDLLAPRDSLQRRKSELPCNELLSEEGDELLGSAPPEALVDEDTPTREARRSAQVVMQTQVRTEVQEAPPVGTQALMDYATPPPQAPEDVKDQHAVMHRAPPASANDHLAALVSDGNSPTRFALAKSKSVMEACSGPSRHTVPSSLAMEAQLLCPWSDLSASPETLAGWGLPPSVVGKYESHGVTRLFPWQRACLFAYYHHVSEQLVKLAQFLEQTPRASWTGQPVTSFNSSSDGSGSGTHAGSRSLPARNLLYSAPTSGGKTLVAEVILLRTILQSGGGSSSSPGRKRRKALYIVPYIALAEEKAKQLEELCEGTGARVQCHAGNRGTAHLWTSDIHVCTNEKAFALWRVLEENGKTSEIGVVVVDEMHHINDEQRGYVLELLLTRLIAHGKSHTDFHLVCLTATLANADLVADWCGGAHLFLTDYRPVRLEEHYVISCMVFDAQEKKHSKPIRDLIPEVNHLRSGIVSYRNRLAAEATTAPDGGSPRNTEPCVRTGYAVEEEVSLLLALEAYRDGYQVMLFAPTRRACEVLSRQLSECVRSGVVTAPAERYASVQQRGGAVAQQLKDSGTAARALLQACLPCGVAFHHAHIGSGDRSRIENAYRDGHVWALCCTTTLSTGVNLPCRRVIFTAIRIGQSALDPMRYKQAAGRAGRTGLVHGFGEVYVIGKPQERSQIQRLLSGALPPIVSNFSPARYGMARVILDGMARASPAAVSVGAILAMAKQTLYASMAPHSTSDTNCDSVRGTTQVALEFLERKQFVVAAHTTAEAHMELTPLGEATAASFLAPDEALLVLHELQLSSMRFCLSDDLHLIFHCTPVFPLVEPDWARLCNQWVPALLRTDKGMAVCEALGIDEGTLSRFSNCPPSRTSLMMDAIRCRRLYAAMILTDVVHEHPIEAIAARYGVSSSVEVHRLIESAALFAGSVSSFASSLNWWYIPPLLDTMIQRLRRGVEPDLLPLMDIEGLAPWRARQLYRSGYRTALSIASATVDDLAQVLAMQQLKGYELKGVGGGGGGEPDDVVRSAAQVIKDAAKAIVLRDARELQAACDTLAQEHHAPTTSRTTPLRVRGRWSSPATPAKVPVEQTTPKESIGVQRAAPPLADPVPRMQEGEEGQWNQSSGSSSSLVDITTAGGVPTINVYLVNLSSATDIRLFKDMFNSLIGKAARGPGAPTPHTASCGPPRKAPRLVGVRAVRRKKKTDIVLLVTVYPSSASSSPSKSKATKPTDPSSVTSADGPAARGICTFCLFYAATSSHAHRDDAAKWGAHWLLKLLETAVIDKSIPGFQQQLHILHAAGWLSNDDNAASSTPAACLKLCQAVHDPFIAAWMLHPDLDVSQEGKYSLPWLLARCPVAGASSADVLLSAPVQLHDAHARRLSGSSPEAVRYFHEDVRIAVLHSVAAIPLTIHLATQLRAQDLYTPYYTVEMKMPAICFAMETVGVGFDTRVYTALHAAMQEKVSQIVQQAYEVVGRSNWSLSSPQQCAKVLYDDMALPCLEHTGDHQYLPVGPRKRSRALKETRSTRASALKQLARMFPANPLPGLIMDFRRLDGWSEKYIVPLQEASRRSSHDQRIRGTFLLTAAATGRLAMTEPSLQTIPHPISFSLRGQEVAVRLRSAFVADRPGWVLLSADYAQIEARLLAHFSGDASLLAVFTDDTTDSSSSTCSAINKKDIFKELAAQLYKKLACDVSVEERRAAKALCYGIIYGRGKNSIADELEITDTEADGLLRGFKETYRTAMAFMSSVVEESASRGYVTTLAGRKRWLPYAHSKNPQARSASERMATNTLCQGSAADIIKEAMIRVMSDPLLQATPIQDSDTQPKPAEDYKHLPEAYMLLQIHDELLFEVKQSALAKVVRMLRRHMDLSRHYGLRVALPVRFHVGPTWGDLSVWDDEAPHFDHVY